MIDNSPEFIQLTINELLKINDQDKVIQFDRKLDQFFFGNINKVESKIIDLDEHSYIGIQSEALLSSYLDYYQILNDLPVGESLLDLGSGYSRGTLLAHYLKLNQCYSVEFLIDRVKCAQNALLKIGIRNQESIVYGDISKISFTSTFAVYLYFPRGKVLDQVLMNLFMIKSSKKRFIYACESHGDLIEYLNSFLNLKLRKTIKASLQRHNPLIHKYEILNLSCKPSWKQNLSLWLLQNRKKKYVLIIDYFHPLLSEWVKWILNVDELEYIIHNDKPALQDLTGRIILISESEKIKEITADFYDVYIGMKHKNFKKLIYHKNFYVETITGELRSICNP